MTPLARWGSLIIKSSWQQDFTTMYYFVYNTWRPLTVNFFAGSQTHHTHFHWCMSTRCWDSYPMGWQYLNWSIDMPSLHHAHINIKTSVVALLAIYQWAPFVRNCNVILHSDNKTTESVINKCACHNDFLMHYLCGIFCHTHHTHFHWCMSTRCWDSYPMGWQYLNWSIDMPSLHHAHINIKTSVVALLAIYQWAPFVRNCNVILHSDNKTTESVINKCACHNDFLMHYLCGIFCISKGLNFTVKCLHIPGINNHMADCVSCLHSRGHILYWYSLISQAKPFSPCHLAMLCQNNMFPATLLHLLQAKPWGGFWFSCPAVPQPRTCPIDTALLPQSSQSIP